MLARIVPVARTLGSVARPQVTRCMGGVAFKPNSQLDVEHQVSMDFMTPAQGSWQENYNKRNTRFNIQLALSFAFFGVTMFAMYKTDCFYLHTQPALKNK